MLYYLVELSSNKNNQINFEMKENVWLELLFCCMYMNLCVSPCMTVCAQMCEHDDSMAAAGREPNLRQVKRS